MLREVKRVRQIPGRPHRRWFEDDHLDLIVWSSGEGAIVGIQLCYDKGTPSERALTWLKDRELSHLRVDDGEDRPFKFKMTPILVPDGTFDGGELLAIFMAASQNLEPAIAKAVIAVIDRFIEANKAVQPTPARGPRG